MEKILSDRPPKNNNPISSTTMTINAPRSGCFTMSPANITMSAAMGINPLENECMYSWRETVYQAAIKSAHTFMTSVTCKFITPKGIQRRDPLTARPTPGINTTANSATASQKRIGANLNHTRIGTRYTKKAAKQPMPILWRCFPRK